VFQLGLLGKVGEGAAIDLFFLFSGGGVEVGL
jgi:hypothetical protein